MLKALLYVLLGLVGAVLLLMNGLNLMGVDRTDSSSSGLLTARATLYNFGATTDYAGNVYVLPRFFPRLWPFDMWIGCRALDFESDPRVAVWWQGDVLVVEHDRFDFPPEAEARCYGRKVVLRERQRITRPRSG